MFSYTGKKITLALSKDNKTLTVNCDGHQEYHRAPGRDLKDIHVSDPSVKPIIAVINYSMITRLRLVDYSYDPAKVISYHNLTECYLERINGNLLITMES